MKRRTSNNPKRRIIPKESLSDATRDQLLMRVRYVGSGHHKRYPADYGLDRANPRPTKSLCDGIGPVSLEDARKMLHQGVIRAMLSELGADGLPKYIWSVSPEGIVYEAKTHPNTPGAYHGYPLEDEDDMRAYVKQIWEQRCKLTGR